jgi:pseudouridine synthase
MPDGSERLQKILSAAGVASRRAAERLIVEGRVSVNGAPATELGTRADPGRDDIRVDGRRVPPPPRRIYLLLNKPRGFVTTRSDPQQRPTVLDLLPHVREYVYPVGRLDYESEGLLIVTNDGDLAARLTHPRHEVERVYEARVRGVPDRATLARLARGIVIDGRRTAPAGVRLLPSAKIAARAHRPRAPRGRSRPASREGAGSAPAAGTSTIEFTLHEGRSRQVRRMCEAVGHPVVRLRRVRIGPITDEQLKVGTCRALTPREVSALQRAGSSAVAVGSTR